MNCCADRSSIRALLAAICALAGLAAPGTPARAADTITLYAPALDSPRPGLGFAVSAVLGLQVWQTLRKAPTPNPQNLNFGDGVVIWDPVAPGFKGHEEAEAAARKADLGAQLVLWGRAYEFGGGVVVQLNLSLPRYHDFRESTPEVWKFFWQDGGPALEADLPARRYSFEPIVLRPEIVERYSRPNALPLYSAAVGGTEVGRLGGEFLALESRSDAVRVKPVSGREGWLHLPELADSRGEVVDFVSGMIRIYRADWIGAREMMTRVVESPSTPTALRLDAALIRARAGVLAGMTPDDIVAELDGVAEPGLHARRAVVYQAMGRLIAARQSSGCERNEAIDAMAGWLGQKDPVFPGNDRWLAACRKTMETGRSACGR